MKYKEARNTILGQSEEANFQQWIRSTPWYPEYVSQYGEEPDLDTPMYDYRGAYSAGVEPQYNPYAKSYHWSSQFKSQDHPTMWMEEFMQRYGFDPDSRGITQEDYENMIRYGE
jgi:hypothetical protein